MARVQEGLQKEKNMSERYLRSNDPRTSGIHFMNYLVLRYIYRKEQFRSSHALNIGSFSCPVFTLVSLLIQLLRIALIALF